MSTEPAPATPKQPDWPLLLLFALLAGAALYALYYAFAAQSAVNRQLALQNHALLKRLTMLEAVQSSSVKSSMLDDLKTELAGSHETVRVLQQRLETLEKTTSAPAPTIQFTAPAAGETETLQQFLALRTAVEKGEAFTQELATASALPEVNDIAEKLQPLAESGTESDAALRDALDDLLEAHPATVIVPDAKLDRINSSLKGLLSIHRKQAAPVDTYAALRAQAEAGATLDILLTSVRDLSDTDRAPLEGWLKKASDRQSALMALKAAEMALLKPRN